MRSERTVARLCLYRRLLKELQLLGVRSIYSHDLAGKAGATAAQVRRDLMGIGFSGTPRHGYEIDGLANALADYLDAPSSEGIALVGVGRLGRALLDYAVGRHPKLHIGAAFDNDPSKVGRVIAGCRCYDIEDSQRVIPEQGIRMAIIAVPATEAQAAATRVVDQGVRGLINFSPVRLHVPEEVYVDNVDVTVSMEKMSFFTRLGVTSGGQAKP